MRARLRSPCLSPFCEERALPAAVLGPLELRHGFCSRARAAWRARRTGVQPLLLRSFVAARPLEP